MSTDAAHHVTVRLARDYEFVAEFNDLPDAPSLLLDEPPPLGDGRAPNPVDVLGAAVGNCLASSFALCLRKAHIEPEDVTVHVTTHVVRNDKGHLRVSGMDVEVVPGVRGEGAARLQRCREIFEDFCTVTASVRQGIPVNVSVHAPVDAGAPK